MQLDVKYFLIANGVVMGLILWSMIRRQKKLQAGPSRLNMRGTGDRKIAVANETRAHRAGGPGHGTGKDHGTGFAGHGPGGGFGSGFTSGFTSGGPRSLNVLFEFDGKVWDAHEVLKVPAGCSLKSAEVSYSKLRKDFQGREKDLLEQAILHVRRNAA